MWEHTLETTTDVPADHLWAVTADVGNWPAWQPGVEVACSSLDSVLVRERGDWVRLTIEESCPPTRFAVAASLLLARVRTIYDFAPDAGSTRVRLTIQLSGSLGFFGWTAVGSRRARGLSALFRRLVERTREVACNTPTEGRPNALSLTHELQPAARAGR